MQEFLITPQNMKINFEVIYVKPLVTMGVEDSETVVKLKKAGARGARHHLTSVNYDNGKHRVQESLESMWKSSLRYKQSPAALPSWVQKWYLAQQRGRKVEAIERNRPLLAWSSSQILGLGHSQHLKILQLQPEQLCCWLAKTQCLSREVISLTMLRVATMCHEWTTWSGTRATNCHSFSEVPSLISESAEANKGKSARVLKE